MSQKSIQSLMILRLKRTNSDRFGKQHLWVPIEKAEVDIKIKSVKRLHQL